MKFTILPHLFKGKFFFISPFTGNLNISDTKIISRKLNSSSKLIDAISYCDNPYNLKSIKNISNYFFKNNYEKFEYMSKLDNYNKTLVWLGNKRFFFSCLYSSFKENIFDNTIEAYDYIDQIEIHKINKGKMCFQRALLAAKTSKSFKKNGVLFIGAILPTWSMHAWIIEDGIQPDREDRMWIMYRPLLAIYY